MAKYSKSEIREVVNVIKSGNVNYVNGKIGKKFESLFSRWVNTKYSVALSNGTVALELAIKSLMLPKKSEIMVTAEVFFFSFSYSKSRSYSQICRCRFNKSKYINKRYRKKITKKTRAIICVHLAGNPCDMKNILRIKKI